MTVFTTDEELILDEDDPENHWSALMNEFAQAPGLSDGAYRLYTILRSYCQKGKPTCFPGHAALARCMGVKSKRTVIRAQQELEEKGCIEIEHRSGRSNLYRVIAAHKHPHVIAATSDKSGTSDKRGTSYKERTSAKSVTPTSAKSVTTPVPNLSHIRRPKEEDPIEENPVEAQPQKIDTKTTKERATAITLLGALPEERRAKVEAVLDVDMWSKFRYKPESLKQVIKGFDRCTHIDHVHLAEKSAAHFEGMGTDRKSIMSLINWWEGDEKKAIENGVPGNGASPNGRTRLTPEQIAEFEDPDHTGSRTTGFWPIPRGTKAPLSPVPEWGQALQRLIDRHEVDRRDFEQILCRIRPQPRDGDILRLMIPRENYTVTHVKESLNWPIRYALQDCAAELTVVYRVEGDSDDLVLRTN